MTFTPVADGYQVTGAWNELWGAAPTGSLAVLSLNVGGIGERLGVTWETRAGRVGAWAKQNQVVPDVIALQEVWGWLWTPPLRSCGRGLAVGAGDYDQIDILLREIRDAIGITYRVAYLTGTEGSFGTIPCGVYGSQAVLYNPARLVNLTAQAGGAHAHNAVHNHHGGPHLRRSLPLCNRSTDLMPLETLIDGPPQTDKCGRETPSGPAWAVYRTNQGIAATFVRLAFVEAPARTIDIFNVHPTAGQEQSDRPLIGRLIAELMPPPYAGSSLYYPPLMVGDLNSLGIESDFPGFITVLSPPVDPTGQVGADPIAIGIATAESVPARYRARATQRMVVPDLPQGVFCPGPVELLVSDHCGLFVRFEWDGPDAGALRGVFIDGPRGVTAGQPYRLQATPSGGGLDYAYRWQPGGLTMPQLDTQAGAPNSVQNWTVQVTDVQTGQARSAQHSVRAQADTSACRESCDARRDDCMACAGGGCPPPAQCVGLLRGCLAGCDSP